VSFLFDSQQNEGSRKNQNQSIKKRSSSCFPFSYSLDDSTSSNEKRFAEWLDALLNVPFNQLGSAEHHMRQGRLDKFPSGNGSNGFREIRRETHSDVLDENLLQRLSCVRRVEGKRSSRRQEAQHNQRIKRGKKEGN
jgi:hypothetical protein